MTTPLFPIEIPKRSSSCFLGKETFEPGQEYFSLLLEDEENEKYIRQDYCSSCWPQAQPLSAKTHWKGRVPVNKEVVKSPVIELPRLFALLHEFLQQNSPETDAYAYVLALYLARKKQLIARKEMAQAGREGTLYEIVESEEMLFVKKVSLQLAEIQSIQKKLEDKLKI